MSETINVNNLIEIRKTGLQALREALTRWNGKIYSTVRERLWRLYKRKISTVEFNS
jgi:hypothetical protein